LAGAGPTYFCCPKVAPEGCGFGRLLQRVGFDLELLIGPAGAPIRYAAGAGDIGGSKLEPAKD